MFELVENIKRPLTLNEILLVPCISQEINGILNITPVINHPHNDIENGQKEVHYHADYRFVKYIKELGNPYPIVINNHSKHYFVHSIRPILGIHGQFGYYKLKVINTEFAGITLTKFIKNSTLKHTCIHKDKCPHRGYDLSQVEPKNGKITCPLHGLNFNSESKQLIQ